MSSRPTRRRFLKHGSTVAATGLLAPSFLLSCALEGKEGSGSAESGTSAAGDYAAGEHRDYTEQLGLQIWTVRDQLAEDPRATLAAIAADGYQHVELMSTEQLATLKPICDELGLGIRSSHYNWRAVTGVADPNGGPAGPTLDKIIEDANAAGVTDVVLAYLTPAERTTLDDYRLRADQMNAAAEKIRAAGLKHAYHNHAFEFEPIDDAGTSGWDILVERLDGDLTPFEIDVFWAALAGRDPAELIEGNKKRAHLLHLKDLKSGVPQQYDESAVPNDAFQEVGDGTLDFEAILSAAREAGVAYCMVEQDQSPDPLASIAVSHRYLVG